MYLFTAYVDGYDDDEDGGTSGDRTSAHKSHAHTHTHSRIKNYTKGEKINKMTASMAIGERIYREKPMGPVGAFMLTRIQFPTHSLSGGGSREFLRRQGTSKMCGPVGDGGRGVAVI